MDRRELARSLDVGEEGCQPIGRQRAVARRLGHPCSQSRRVGQRGPTPLLRRRGRQEAGWRVVALQHAVAHQRVEARSDGLGAGEGRVLVGARDGDEGSGIGRADVGTQAGIERERVGAHGAERRQLAAPGGRRQCEHEHGGNRERDHRATGMRQHRRGRSHEAAELTAKAGTGSAIGREHGKDEAGRRSCCREPRKREDAELRQTRKAREDQRREADQRGEEAEPHRRPALALPACCRARAAVRLHEVVDRVVDSFADQRRAEAERHAVDLAEDEAHGGDAREYARRDRNDGDGERTQRGEGDQQQGDDEHRAEHGEPLDLALDAGPRRDREAAGAGDHEAKPRRGGAVESSADRGDCALLAVEVSAVGGGRRDEHGARRAARDPDAVLAFGRVRRRERFGDAQGLAGRVAIEDRLQQRAGRRAEQRHGVVDRVAQSRRREPARVDGRAERVAMREEESAGVGPGRGVAVVDRREELAGAQLRGEPARGVGARGSGGLAGRA